MSGARVALMGAGGLVGSEILRQLAERNFPVAELRLGALSKSVGQKIDFQGQPITVEPIGEDFFRGIDLAFFAASTEASKQWAPVAVKSGAVVIDKSNAFRQDPTVPLVVPEVNPGDIKEHRGIIASPNCSTIQMVVALWPLHQAATIQRIVVSTYQAVSGTGREAMEELTGETRAWAAGREYQPAVYPKPIAFNLLPHIDDFEPSGYSKEEMKMVNETRRIFHLPELPIAATTVRVPVLVSHSESVLIETEGKLTRERAREILRQAPSVVVVDAPERGEYPVPIEAAGRDEVFVGRIREDLSSPHGLHLWVVSDNLRKGAATNALQIAEVLRG